MEIEIYNTVTGEIKTEGGTYFIIDGSVYRDNGRGCESQEAYVTFDDFIVECPHLDWRIV